MKDHKVPQIHVRLPQELREQLDEISKREHWTLNQAMIEAVKMLLKSKE